MLTWVVALSGPALVAVALIGVADLARRRDVGWPGRIGWVAVAVVTPALAAVTYVLTRPPTGAPVSAADAPRGRRERAVQRIGSAAARGLFRDVEVLRPVPPSPDRARLYVVSHFGAFSDPIALVDALERPPRFLAADGLFRVPVLGWVLRAASAVPPRRSQDGAGGANRSAFETAWAALRAGDPVAIFPEGIANDTTTLAPLRTGAARVALGAATPGLLVVAVGVHYEDKARLRRRVLVDVGAPLDVDDWLAARGAAVSDAPGEPPRDLARALTEELTVRLAAVAPTFADADEQRALLAAAGVALRTTDGPASFGRVADLADALAERPRPDRERLVAAATRYRDELDAAGLADADLVGRGRAPARRLLRTLVVGALLAPPALLGAVVHAPAAVLVWLSRRLRVAPVTAATVRPLVALVTVAATWVIVTWAAARSGLVDGVLAVAAFALVVLPLWGLAALVVGERVWLAVVSVGRDARRLVSRRPRRRGAEQLLGPLRDARDEVVALVGAGTAA